MGSVLMEHLKDPSQAFTAPLLAQYLKVSVEDLSRPGGPPARMTRNGAVYPVEEFRAWEHSDRARAWLESVREDEEENLLLLREELEAIKLRLTQLEERMSGEPSKAPTKRAVQDLAASVVKAIQHPRGSTTVLLKLKGEERLVRWKRSPNAEPLPVGTKVRLLSAVIVDKGGSVAALQKVVTK